LLQTSLQGYSQLFPGLVTSPGAIDSNFGPQTKSSLESFQANIGAGPVDGIAGPVTWSQLDDRDYSFPYVHDLNKGAQGNPVRHLQRLLFAVGTDPGPVDGIYGDRTAAAVSDFQKTEGLPQTGNASGQTRILLSFVNV
jgi:peptidoglycan hydrolase-like protein with peptidoglycan-binding domain